MANYGNISQKSPTVQDTVLSIFRNEIDRLDIAIKLARDIDRTCITKTGVNDLREETDDAPQPPRPTYSAADLHDAIIAASGYITTIKNFLPLITIKEKTNG